MEDCQQQRERRLQEGDRDHDNFVEYQQRMLPGLPPKMSLTLTRRGHEQHRPRPRPYCSKVCHLGNSSCPTHATQARAHYPPALLDGARQHRPLLADVLLGLQ
jgi:hypothetical protein